MFDGLFSPLRLDSDTLPARNDLPWESNTKPATKSTTIHREAPEVVYSLQAQCDDDYFLNVNVRHKGLLSKMLPIALQQRMESLVQRIHRR